MDELLSRFALDSVKVAPEYPDSATSATWTSECPVLDRNPRAGDGAMREQA